MLRVVSRKWILFCVLSIVDWKNLVDMSLLGFIFSKSLEFAEHEGDVSVQDLRQERKTGFPWGEGVHGTVQWFVDIRYFDLHPLKFNRINRNLYSSFFANLFCSKNKKKYSKFFIQQNNERKRRLHTGLSELCHHLAFLASLAGVASEMEGLVQYEDLLTLLTCLQCGCLVSPPVAQCRKGHLYCLSCKWAPLNCSPTDPPQIRKSQGLNSCRICKQTFVDAPNQALEKMVGMIGLPCKYGARGCSELVFLPSRLQHETLCRSQKTTNNNKNNNNQSPDFDRLSVSTHKMVATKFSPTRWPPT